MLTCPLQTFPPMARREQDSNDWSPHIKTTFAKPLTTVDLMTNLFGHAAREDLSSAGVAILFLLVHTDKYRSSALVVVHDHQLNFLDVESLGLPSRAGRSVSARLKGTPPRAKTDFYLHGAQISMINRSCLLPLPMMLLTQNFDAASPVTQINQGRACDLGRGLQVKSKIRSPHSTHNLKILQCNINGLTSPETRIKLDQLLEIALKQDVKVIAVQETKLKESTSLKVKGFNIFRVDRKSKSGGDRRKQLLESFNENNSLNDSQGGLRTEINQINAKIRKSYAQLKRSRWRELCKNLDSRTTNSKLWRIVKKINKEQEQCEESNSVIDTNGQVFPDDKAAANGLAVYYQETSKFSEDKSVMKRAKNIIHGCRTSDVGDQGLSRDFSQQELLLAMAFLDLTKSPGPDGVFGRMLENLGHRGKLRLLDIINLSWKIGHLPAEWKRAIIIPIKKAGKNNWSPKDFRPIALTSTTCKIMEKMILIRIQYFLDSKNLIPGEQYGYRRGHSTVDQIISFCQSIRDAQNCKHTHHTMAALLDLTKAFDRVWKHKLLIKLHDTFNIRGNTLAWNSDFLHHRSMRVNFNNTFSDPVVHGQGVPQGSVLSLTLFSLYLAGIEKIPSVEMRVGLFADDIVIWCSGRDLVEMERNLNNALSSFSDYALEFKLCFNPTKSIATFFTTNKRLYSYQPTLKMDNKNLAYEKHPKYLGYVLDPLNAGKDWGADAVTLRDTFLALIRPILEYGFPVYCCASAASLEKLEKIQLGAARIITGLRRSCPKEIVLFEADLQPLHLRSKNILTNYFNKLSSYGNHNKTSLYFNNWHNNQRLKRNSPFSYADHLQLPSSHIEPHSLKSCLSPSEGLPRVHFHFNMSAPVTKQDLIPAHLRQLALKVLMKSPVTPLKFTQMAVD
ncbi:probable RNA-directed DNA polymerase from transposon BS [Trichonephila clavipes]|nr:probable RNA-directed DNA polymerase from transposon BS [Trichonephila clavipes]